MTNKQQWVNLTTDAKLNIVDTYRINPAKVDLWETHKTNKDYEPNKLLIKECPELLTGVTFDRAINNKYGYLKDIKTSPCKPSMFTLFQVLVDDTDEDDQEVVVLKLYPSVSDEVEITLVNELKDGCTLVEVATHLNSKTLVVDMHLNRVEDVFKNSRGEYVVMCGGELKTVDKSELFNINRGSVERWVAYNISTGKASPNLFTSEDQVDARLDGYGGEDWTKAKVVHEIESYISLVGQYNEVVSTNVPKLSKGV
jgi:hypothetical protein